MKRSKNLLLLLFILSLVCLISLVLYCFMLWPWADDFVYIQALKNNSLWEFTIYEGTHVDSRWMSPLAFIRNIIFKYLSHQLALIFYLVIFYINSALILFEVLHYRFGGIKENIIFYTFFTLTLFYGLNIVVSEVIFWQAGAYYQLNLLVGLVAIIILEKSKFHCSILFKSFSIFIFILCGTLTYNLSISLLFYGIILLLTQEFTPKKYFVFLLFLLTVTMLLMVLMPASLNRVSGNYSFIKRTLIALRAFVHVPAEYFRNAYSVFTMSLFSFVFYLYSPVSYQKDVEVNSLKNLLFIFRYPILALSTIIPFLIAPDLASKRTSLYFMIFIGLFILISTRHLFGRVFQNLLPLKNISLLIIFIFLVFHLYTIADHFYIAYDLKKQYVQRVSHLKKMAKLGAKKVIIEPYKFEMFIPFSLQSLRDFELTKERNDWRNNQYQSIYNIDTVLVANTGFIK